MRKVLFLLCICLHFCNAQTPFKIKKMLFEDNFETRLDTTKWFSEISRKEGNSVDVRDKAMVINVNYGATIWFKEELKNAWMIEFDRTVPMNGSKNDRLADFNVFWQATDPNKKIWFGRDPKFANYDTLQLYYLGFGGHKNTTTRFRKYEGTGNKDILIEYTDAAHLLEANKTYHCRIFYKNGLTYFYINDVLFVKYQDPQPIKKGYFAFRTLESNQIIDNFKVFEVE